MAFQNTVAMLLQFLMFSLTTAAPIVAEGHHGNTWQYGAGGGVVGFIVLILDIIVFIEVLKSTRPVSHKLLWCVGVFLFPVVGLIVYWLFSDREAHAPSGGYETIA